MWIGHILDKTAAATEAGGTGHKFAGTSCQSGWHRRPARYRSSSVKSPAGAPSHERVGSYGKLSKATSADRFTYTAT